MKRLALARYALLLSLALLPGLLPPARAEERAPSNPATAYPFTFRDVGDEAGLFPHLAGIRGHAAGWGDADGDGWIDLYVGAFYENAEKPNQLLRNVRGKFQLDQQQSLRIAGRPSAALFADLDNDGDLDLYVSSMPKPRDDLLGCRLFRNDGAGKYTDISADNGACPTAFGGRSAAVLDFDGDGLLDLLVGEDPNPGYNGSNTKSSRLFRNLGQLRFEDVSAKVGLPAGIPGLGVAAADVNNDGWPDFFLASSGGGNVLLLNDGHGQFREAPGSRELFAWKDSGGDNMVCGIAAGDINRDGLLDLVVGQHFKRPWSTPVAERLYLNRGIKDGTPIYEDISQVAGMTPLPMKGPHVEFQDFDNDGWPDLYVSIVKFAEGKSYPLIFRHQGLRDGLPVFREDVLRVNDFPTDADRNARSTGAFAAKMIEERKIIYTAPGPSGDFDNDGRLDLFLANWWPESRSLLLHNETAGGNWLQVCVEGAKQVNRMGIGSRVKVYRPGKLGDPAALVGCQEIAAGFGYASGQAAIAHFGLGTETRVDFEVTLPHGRGTRQQRDVAANQRITIGP